MAIWTLRFLEAGGWVEDEGCNFYCQLVHGGDDERAFITAKGTEVQGFRAFLPRLRLGIRAYFFLWLLK